MFNLYLVRFLINVFDQQLSEENIGGSTPEVPALLELATDEPAEAM